MVNKGEAWKVPVILFADDAVLLSEDECELQGLVSEFGTVCRRRNLKVNANKSIVMVFEREESTGCSVMVGGERLENVGKFKYLECSK